MEDNQTHSINHTDHPDGTHKLQDEISYRGKSHQFFQITLGQDSVLILLVFLKLLAIVYIAVFASTFIQIPVLFGENGLASVGHFLAKIQRINEGNFSVFQVPTLLWASEYVNSFIITLFPGLSSFPASENTLYLLCFVNIAIAFGIILDSKAIFFMKSWSFVVLWISFLSIYVVAEPFFTSDTDKLLLEIGFIAIFFVPSKVKGTLQVPEFACAAKELLKWLAFRVIFMNGVGKLLRGDSTWWNLSAYSYYSQTYPLPGSSSKFFHYLPKDIHQLTAAFTLSTQIFCPLLFYATISGLRTAAVFVNIAQQVFEMVVGNFSWLNLCVILLLISILDGHVVQYFSPSLFLKPLGISKLSFQSNSQKQTRSLLAHSVEVILCGIIIVAQFVLFFPLEEIRKGELVFDLKYLKDNIINSYYLTIPLYFAIVFGVIRIAQCSISRKSSTEIIGMSFGMLKAIPALCFFIFMFAASLPPFFENIQANLSTLPINPDHIHKAYQIVQPIHIIHSYTPLNIVKGIQGRNELVIQGSYDNDQWVDYEFLYKPGKLEEKGKFIGIYQPRIDLKLAEAAYSDINHEAWLISLIRKLFANSIEISNLTKECPFHQIPPDYIRLKLFKYEFADIKFDKEWKVLSVEDYLPPIHKKDPVIQEFLEKREYPFNAIEVKRETHPCEHFPLFKGIYYAAIFAILYLWVSLP